MAKTLSKTGITDNSTIETWHVTQSVDALTGDPAYNITISGSLTLNSTVAGSKLTGSFTGSFAGDGSSITGVTAEWDGSHTGNASITGSLIVTSDITGNTLHIPGSGNEGLYLDDLGGKPMFNSSAANNAILIGAAHSSGLQNGINLYTTGSDQTKGLFIDAIGNVTASGDISASGYAGSTINLVTDPVTISATRLTISSSNVSTHKANRHVFYEDETLVLNLQNQTAEFSVNITSSANISASGNVYGVTGSFSHVLGDGSQLTNLPSSGGGGLWSGSASNPRATGDVQITGSLVISGSFHAFTLDSDNVVLGSGAGSSMEAGANNNVVLGNDAGNSLTTGDVNVIIGQQAGQAISTSGYNVCIGRYAGYGVTGQQNIIIGESAGFGALSGGANVIIGQQAGYAMGGLANNNVVLGKLAGRSCASGDSNVMVGYYAGYSITSGDGNIFIGSGSLGEAATANQLRIGNGNDLVTISASLATGDIIFPSTASAAYFSGDGSNLTNVSAFPFTGDAQITGSLTISGSFHSFRVIESNVVLGSGAGAALRTSDTNNVLIGVDAGAGITSDDVIAIGHSAGGSINFSDSTVIGKNAGLNVQASANSMVLIGELAGQRADSGDTYIGMNSGTGAGSGGSSGQFNTGLGYASLGGINGGGSNIGIGRNAGASITSGDGNICIGSGSLGEAAMSNQLRIGSGNSLVTISASLATGETIVRSQRPITTHTVDFTASMDYIGQYNRVSGDLTCSILPTATYAVAMGAEFDFFQTSSAGYMLFESGSGVTLNAKNNNLNLAGQFSSATLKKVGSDEWDLMGDLT